MSTTLESIDWGIVARAIHVVGVVMWVGGVGLVTTVLLPSVKEEPTAEWAREFDAIERRFAPQARIAVLVVLLSGLYMLYHYDLWSRFAYAEYWWMASWSAYGWCLPRSYSLLSRWSFGT